MTQTENTASWVPPNDQTLPWKTGWGFDYRSPSGNVNDATMIRLPDGTVETVTGTPGNWTYTPVATPTPADAPDATATASAKGLIDSQLAGYGLSSLADWAWQKWQAGESIDQIFLELTATPEFKARYPAYETLAQKGQAISVDQYRQLEQTYTQIGRQYGLPAGFYDQPSDFTDLIAGQVSPVEYQQRLQDYQAVAYEVDPTIRNELSRLYGIDEGHLAAYFIDPEKALPALQKQFAATQAATASSLSGYGELTQAQAESLSSVDQSQLAQGFGNLVQNRELFHSLAGEAGQNFDTQVQLGAQFLGDAQAQQQIENQAARRKAAFSGGGGFTSSQQGYSGVG